MVRDRQAIPAAKYLGIRSIDLDRCGLDDNVAIKLSDTDKKRAKQIANYPWFEKKKPWQKEISQMLKNDYKLEVEALINNGISYQESTSNRTILRNSRIT